MTLAGGEGSTGFRVPNWLLVAAATAMLSATTAVVGSAFTEYQKVNATAAQTTLLDKRVDRLERVADQVSLLQGDIATLKATSVQTNQLVQQLVDAQLAKPDRH